MLRRKPTALTISSEDIQIFEDKINRRIAYAHFKKTGEDPHVLFTGENVTQSRQHQQRNQQFGTTSRQGEQNRTTDPNDELKPLPGDKARIVRSREERIVGAGTSTTTGR